MKKRIIVSERQMNLINGKKKRILVNESQLKRIVEYINKGEKEVLEEGWATNVVATLALVASTLGFDAKAQNVASNPEVQEKAAIELAKKTGQDKEKIKADLKANSVKYEDLLKKPGRKTKEINQGTFDVNKVIALINRGYKLENVKEVIGTPPDGNNALVLDSITEHPFASDDAFETGSFELSESAQQEIISIANSLKGSKVKSITIEASTDTEPIKIGNDVLAKKRAEAVKMLLAQNGIDTNVINIGELHPNSGPDVYGDRTMSPEERQSKRAETAQYRYVNVTIDASLTTCVPEDGEIPDEAAQTFYQFTKLVKRKKPSRTIKPPKTPKITGKWAKGSHCSKSAMVKTR